MEKSFANLELGLGLLVPFLTFTNSSSFLQ